MMRTASSTTTSLVSVVALARFDRWTLVMSSANLRLTPLV